MATVEDLLAPGRELAATGDGLLSAMPEAQRAANYDRAPGIYDRVIPSRLYNRLFWGTDPGDYAGFAREAIEDADGPLLDVAGGTGVFTAAEYRASGRQIVLSDLSLGMLARARDRLRGAENVTLVQADATDPPFAPGAFATVACMSALHVFEDPGEPVAALRGLLAPGGRMFLSGLAAETRIGSPYLRFLRRAGQTGPPLREAELVERITDAAGIPPALRRRGSMAYLVVTTP